MLTADPVNRAGNAVQMPLKNGSKERVAVWIILIEATDRYARARGDARGRAAAQSLASQNLNGSDMQRVDGGGGTGLNRAIFVASGRLRGCSWNANSKTERSFTYTFLKDTTQGMEAK